MDEHNYLNDCPACGSTGLRNRGHTCVSAPPGYVTVAALKQVEAQLAELQADRERLDWLERSGEWNLTGRGAAQLAKGRTLRDAIDSAREAE